MKSELTNTKLKSRSFKRIVTLWDKRDTLLDSGYNWDDPEVVSLCGAIQMITDCDMIGLTFELKGK